MTEAEQFWFTLFIASLLARIVWEVWMLNRHLAIPPPRRPFRPNPRAPFARRRPDLCPACFRVHSGPCKRKPWR